MRKFIFTFLLFASAAGYSQQIMVGRGYEDVIGYLEENVYEWTTDTDTLYGEEVLVVDALNYIGSFRYILYKIHDICYMPLEKDRYKL